MKKNHLIKIIDQLLTGRASEKDLNAFDKFVHFHQRSNKEIPLGVRDKIWKQVENKTIATKSIRLSPGLFLKIAASIALLVSFFFLGIEPRMHHTENEFAAIDTITQIELPDGSMVTLNVKSKVTYRDGFGKTHRDISLSGEAFFDVKRNEELPFTITSGDISTTVLGTSFNVLAYPEEAPLVTVQSGKVKVSSQASEVLLENGEQVMLDGNKLIKNKVSSDLAIYFQWQAGELILPNLEFKAAIKRIARYYNYSVDLNHVSDVDCRIRGAFDQEDTLSKILYGLKYSFDEFNYRIEHEKIIVESISCER
ncbi:MAG: FecR domain-containing protein [Bacteroidota bacterium]